MIASHPNYKSFTVTPEVQMELYSSTNLHSHILLCTASPSLILWRNRQWKEEQILLLSTNILLIFTSHFKCCVSLALMGEVFKSSTSVKVAIPFYSSRRSYIFVKKKKIKKKKRRRRMCRIKNVTSLVLLYWF